MKLKLRLATASAALLFSASCLPVFAAMLPPYEAAAEDNFTVSGGDSLSEDTDTFSHPLPEDQDSVSSGNFCPPIDSPANQPPASEGSVKNPGTAPEKAPLFTAHIEYSPQGYVTAGTFTEFLPGTVLAQPMYSLDGDVWHTCNTKWDLKWLGSDDAGDLKALQNQKCLFDTQEPLADYLAGRLDRFFLKLQLTLANGITYETQTAVIDRGEPQPLPEEYTLYADFTPAIRIRQWRPFKSQGQYQITVSVNAAAEDISALLPAVLPIDVQLYREDDFFTNAAVSCPVTWKPLSLPELTPGESVTIEDAAEEIVIPAGTLLNTPNGIFRLTEPLAVDHDEVWLILNVTREDPQPTGTLHSYFAGLEISFDLKPTGATAIRAYTLSEGESSWSEVSEPLSPDTVNAPSSTASSLFTFVLTAAQEPYRSWLAAWNAGEEPTPFLVGLIIEGGVYDGQQLILAFPDTYETPLQPPRLNGSGGNECNAGSDNKNDSTSAGQRPNLPQDPGRDPDDGQDSPPNPQDTSQATDSEQNGPPDPQDTVKAADSEQSGPPNPQDISQVAEGEQNGPPDPQDTVKAADSGQDSSPHPQDTARISGRKPKNPLQQVESARNSLRRQAAELPVESRTALSVSALNLGEEQPHVTPGGNLKIAAAIVCLAFVIYARARKHPHES